MDKFNLLSLIALIAIFISFLLSFFLLTVKSKNRLANILLASFIMLSAIDISGIFIGQYLQNKSDLYVFAKSFSFLIFPSFYYYVLSICYINFKLKFKSLLHAVPFVLYNLLIFGTLLFDKNDLISLIIHKSLWISITFSKAASSVLFNCYYLYFKKKTQKFTLKTMQVVISKYINGYPELY